eukprot:2118210-Amphidinium_carterae.1
MTALDRMPLMPNVLVSFHEWDVSSCTGLLWTKGFWFVKGGLLTRGSRGTSLCKGGFSGQGVQG